ncbi:hypothetical protein [Algivirga pacifica]|uniref:Uncharacterized protein n=1 Tax=Algivirga pacifica TaxID=1162670 RepID=A0ABP9DLT6_9BACT
MKEKDFDHICEQYFEEKVVAPKGFTARTMASIQGESALARKKVENASLKGVMRWFMGGMLVLIIGTYFFMEPSKDGMVTLLMKQMQDQVSLTIQLHVPSWNILLVMMGAGSIFLLGAFDRLLYKRRVVEQ